MPSEQAPLDPIALMQEMANTLREAQANTQQALATAMGQIHQAQATAAAAALPGTPATQITAEQALVAAAGQIQQAQAAAEAAARAVAAANTLMLKGTDTETGLERGDDAP